MAALVQQRLPAQKTPPSASVLLAGTGGATGAGAGAGVKKMMPTPTLYATSTPPAHAVKREPESFAMQM